MYTWRRRLLNYADKVRDDRNHSTNRRCVFALDDLVEPRESKALYNQFVSHRRCNLRTVVLDLDLARCFCHCLILSELLPTYESVILSEAKDPEGLKHPPMQLTPSGTNRS